MQVLVVGELPLQYEDAGPTNAAKPRISSQILIDARAQVCPLRNRDKSLCIDLEEEVLGLNQSVCLVS